MPIPGITLTAARTNWPPKIWKTISVNWGDPLLEHRQDRPKRLPVFLAAFTPAGLDQDYKAAED